MRFRMRWFAICRIAPTYLTIADSGGIQEEGPTLGKPILDYGKVTERSEGLATGGVKLVIGVLEGNNCPQ
jgi:UDP-N-acetylglucosamine 2-epimerase